MLVQVPFFQGLRKLLLCTSLLLGLLLGDGHPCHSPLENSGAEGQEALQEISTWVIDSWRMFQLIKTGIYVRIGQMVNGQIISQIEAPGVNVFTSSYGDMQKVKGFCAGVARQRPWGSNPWATRWLTLLLPFMEECYKTDQGRESASGIGTGPPVPLVLTAWW